MAVTYKDFAAALQRVFVAAEQDGRKEVTVKAGELVAQVGVEGRTPMCCGVMYRAIRLGDEVIDGPDSGFGTMVTVRYRLPRLRER